MNTVKHWHDWKLQNTFCGDGTNGSVAICDCGARRMTGTRTESVKVDGKTYFREEAINRYARAGESLVLEDNPREEKRQERVARRVQRSGL